MEGREEERGKCIGYGWEPTGYARGMKLTF